MRRYWRAPPVATAAKLTPGTVRMHFGMAVCAFEGVYFKTTWFSTSSMNLLYRES
jgi:hypothetical protein